MNTQRNTEPSAKTTSRMVVNKSAGLSFEKALVALKEGSILTRPKWKGNWIKKDVNPISGTVILASGFVSSISGTWTISAEDLFADDWQIVARAGTLVQDLTESKFGDLGP